MKNLIKSTLTCTLIALSIAPLVSAQEHTNHELGLNSHLFGLGVFYGYQINEQWTARGQIGGADTDAAEFEITGLDYEGDLDSSYAGIGIDWRPFASGWAQKVYFTGGLMSLEGEFKGDAQSKIGENIKIGSANISSNSINALNVDIEYDRHITPYLGIGWRSKAANEAGLAFTAEIVAINLDDPTVSLTAEDPNNVLSQSNLDAESAQIKEDLGGNTAYASFGLSYRF